MFVLLRECQERMDNKMKKKLTYGDGAPLALSVFAVILSAAAVFSEFIGRAVFNYFFDSKRSYILSAGKYMFFQNYGRVLTVFVLSVSFCFILLKSRKKKCVSASECSVVILASLTLGAYSFVQLCHEFKTGVFMNFSGLNDSELFISLFKYCVEAFTILPAVFLILSTLTMFARLSAETFKVNVERQLPLVFEVDNSEPVIVEGIKSVVEESEMNTDSSQNTSDESNALLDIIKEENSDDSDVDLTSISDADSNKNSEEAELENQVSFDSISQTVAEG